MGGVGWRCGIVYADAGDRNMNMDEGRGGRLGGEVGICIPTHTSISIISMRIYANLFSLMIIVV